MTEQPHEKDITAMLPADPRERRRIIVRSMVRVAVTTTGLLVLYAFVPVPGRSGAAAILGMTLGLLVFVGLVGWQIRTIARADHPIMRAVEVIGLALPLLVVVFAFTYLSLSRADAASFSEPLDRIDAMYYTVSAVSTVGFGDIVAKTDAARILMTAQMLFDLALIAGLVRVIIVATRTGLRRQGVSGEVGLR